MLDCPEGAHSSVISLALMAVAACVSFKGTSSEGCPANAECVATPAGLSPCWAQPQPDLSAASEVPATLKGAAPIADLHWRSHRLRHVGIAR